MLSWEMLLSLTPLSLLSWISESFRHDIGQFHSPQMRPCNLERFFYIKTVYNEKSDRVPLNGGNRCGYAPESFSCFWFLKNIFTRKSDLITRKLCGYVTFIVFSTVVFFVLLAKSSKSLLDLSVFELFPNGYFRGILF